VQNIYAATVSWNERKEVLARLTRVCVRRVILFAFIKIVHSFPLSRIRQISLAVDTGEVPSSTLKSQDD
jgi:hypothetical protein